MDYSQFRASSGQGAAVGVNHRALITRALTKYPVDYALFRELLQNSADARSTSAVIQLETPRGDIAGSQLHDAPITHLRFTNDGLDFAPDDWARLREIASGNPNETKIGAFGVGFYSVFELTDEPLVHSGNQVMSFKYHGVQLHYYFTEKAPTYQKGTLIDLPYREEQALPDLVKFVGFLVQSFMLVNLNEIRLELKHGGRVTKLLHLTKTAQKPQLLPQPPSFQTKSPNRTLNMTRIERTKVNVSIEYLNATQMPPLSLSKGVFSFGRQLVSSLLTTSTDPDEYTVVECDLLKADAFLDVSVSSGFRKKMLETLLKPPPKQAVMSLISFPGIKSLPQKSQLTSYIFPNDYNDAKIFIGFATKQSTGFKSHLALNQVIPTMERTAVDMSNQFVKDWNSEMLYMGGVMARCVYEYELSNFQSLGEKGMEDALFVCSRFRFGKSAPEAVIGLYVREGFWNCSRETLVPSTQGILPSVKVRLPGDAADVLRRTPVVSDQDLAKDLEKLGYVQVVSLSEICADIASSVLTKDQFVNFVDWLAKKWPRLDTATRTQFLSATNVRGGDEEQVYNLGLIAWYHDRTLHSEEELAATLPANCLPFDLATTTGMQKLEVLGIHALRLPVWVECRVKKLASGSMSSDQAAKIAQAMLHVSSRTWPRLSKSQRLEISRSLNSVKCMPTQQGLKLPAETYAQEIKLFPNLPVVSPHVDVSRVWLLDIGVRQSMDMEFVLHALESRELKWNNEDLVQYLCENENMLKAADWEILRKGAFFKKRSGNENYCRVSELYAPQVELVRLGLPTLDFAGWSDHSAQSELLFKIGLKRFPSAKVLFQSQDKEGALHYFVTHYNEARYSSSDVADLEIVPTLQKNRYVKPSQCFRDAELLYFGEHVISHKWEAFSSRLGVAQRPPTQVLVHRVLRNPEKFLMSSSQCDNVFAYFSRYTGEIPPADLHLCRTSSFIPVYDTQGSLKSWEKPGNVFLPLSERDNGEDVLRPLLQTIHPSQSAIPFLHLLGVSNKPTLSQTVAMMLQNPGRVFDVLKSAETYKEVLISIERQWASIAHNPKLIEGMRIAPFLLGVKYSGDQKDNDDLKGEIALRSAADLAIVDDVISFNQFREHIYTAPQDDTIEKLYRRLGVRFLSQTLKEKITIGLTIDNEARKNELEFRINERLRLFLDNTSKQLKPEWSKSVNVSLVRSLELRRDLPPHTSIVVQKSAFMSPTAPNTLLVVPGEQFEWIDVAVALSKAYLVKPDQDSFVVLETQLSSDLRSLEKKGYNVGKLRGQGLQKFERKAPKLEFSGEKPESDLTPTASKSPTVAPWTWPMLGSAPLKPKSGDRTAASPLQQSAQQLNPHNYPAKSPGIVQQGAERQGKNFFSHVKSLIPQSLGGSHQEEVPGQPGNSRDLQQRLQSALNRGLAYDSSNLTSPLHNDTPSPLPERSCTNNRKIFDLKALGPLANGVKVFATLENPQPRQDELLLSESLIFLCSVFGYSPAAVHIYRDNDTSTIAFNQNGSLFFNSCVDPEVPFILDYYYPVMAHELAHNLVSSHGAAHSYYAEAYIQHSIGVFAARREQS